MKTVVYKRFSETICLHSTLNSQMREAPITINN